MEVSCTDNNWLANNNIFYGTSTEVILYKVAIYLRLSREDDPREVSESILNQKEFLIKYVKNQPNWYLVDIYIDDRIYWDKFQ